MNYKAYKSKLAFDATWNQPQGLRTERDARMGYQESKRKSGPVKHLSQFEIAKLNLTPPKHHSAS